MKKLLPVLACLAFVGCLGTRSPKVEVGKKPATGLAAEAKLAEKLPIVTPESVTAQNAASKARELAEELNRDFRRGDAARNVADVSR